MKRVGRFDIWGLISREEEERERLEYLSKENFDIKPSQIAEVKIKETKKTYLVNLSDYNVSDFFIVLDKRGKGQVEEISIKANGDYKVIFELDGDTLYYDDMSNLIEESSDIENLVAVYREGNYIFGLRNFYFLNDVKLVVRVSSPTVFSKLYVKCLVEKDDGKQISSL